MGLFAVNFEADFNAFWASVSGSLGSLPQLASTIGMILLVGAIVKFFWDKRKAGGGGGGGQNNTTLMYTAIFATILAAPEILIPFFLKIVDVVINALIAAAP